MSACRAPVAAQARTSRIAFRFEARLCAASCASAACLLGIPSVLQAASPPKRGSPGSRAPGLSRHERLIAELTHRRSRKSELRV